MKRVKALIFDVFGTVVDWRTSVEAELKALGDKHGIEADWAKFAQEWRTSYMNDTFVNGTANVNHPNSRASPGGVSQAGVKDRTMSISCIDRIWTRC